MKKSLYNWSVIVDGTIVLFNGFTGAIIELDESHSHIAKLLEGENSDVSAELFSTEEMDLLKHAGMIIESDFDERFYLETCMKKLRYGDTLTLTAVITRQCNFSCTYCSQSEYTGGPTNRKNG